MMRARAVTRISWKKSRTGIVLAFSVLALLASCGSRSATLDSIVQSSPKKLGAIPADIQKLLLDSVSPFADYTVGRYGPVYYAGLPGVLSVRWKGADSLIYVGWYCDSVSDWVRPPSDNDSVVRAISGSPTVDDYRNVIATTEKLLGKGTAVNDTTESWPGKLKVIFDRSLPRIAVLSLGYGISPAETGLDNRYARADTTLFSSLRASRSHLAMVSRLSKDTTYAFSVGSIHVLTYQAHLLGHYGTVNYTIMPDSTVGYIQWYPDSTNRDSLVRFRVMHVVLNSLGFPTGETGDAWYWQMPDRMLAISKPRRPLDVLLMTPEARKTLGGGPR